MKSLLAYIRGTAATYPRGDPGLHALFFLQAMHTKRLLFYPQGARRSTSLGLAAMHFWGMPDACAPAATPRRDDPVQGSADGKRESSRRDDYPRGGGGGYGGGSSAPVGRGPPPMAPPNFRSKGSAHRVLVKGLPMSASWQDLKVPAPVIVPCPCPPPGRTSRCLLLLLSHAFVRLLAGPQGACF